MPRLPQFGVTLPQDTVMYCGVASLAGVIAGDAMGRAY